MNGCIPRPYEADGGCPASLLGDGLAGPVARQVRDRQAAILYLEAATKAANAAVRDDLRRRAARLLSTVPTSGTPTQ